MITPKELKYSTDHTLQQELWKIEKELERRNAGIVCGGCGERVILIPPMSEEDFAKIAKSGFPENARCERQGS